MKNTLFCLALAVTSAQAGLIVTTENTDLTAFGFGTSPSILTLQRTTLEQGCVIPTDDAGGFSTSCVGGPGGYTDLLGSLVSETNKYATPTLTELGVTSFANLAVLFNVNEPGDSQQVTLQNLTLALYDGTTLVYFFGLTDESGSGITDLTDIAQGQGSAGYVIRISPEELIPLGAFDGSLRVGLSATVGCTSAAGCDTPLQFGTADGPESFTVANVESGVVVPLAEIPEPATSALLGGGLILIGWTLRRRRIS